MAIYNVEGLVKVNCQYDNYENSGIIRDILLYICLIFYLLLVKLTGINIRKFANSLN